jgi:ribosomal protein L37AE/L43A
VDAQQIWPCPACGDDAVFEQPPCADGHGSDGGECPEWACTGCGAAFLSGDPGPAAEVLAARAA